MPRPVGGCDPRPDSSRRVPISAGRPFRKRRRQGCRLRSDRYKAERSKSMESGVENRRGFTLWFTGLSGAGETTIAEIVEHELRERGLQVEVLDGDIVRTNLSKGLSFSRDDRNVNVLRIGFVANLLTRNGVGVIVSAISPYKEARDQVRRRIVDFVEVFVDAPLEVCAERDVKGLYKKAFAGEIEGFTGVSDPYEPPAAPDLVLKTAEETPEESARKVIEKLEFYGYLWSPTTDTEYNWGSR